MNDVTIICMKIHDVSRCFEVIVGQLLEVGSSSRWTRDRSCLWATLNNCHTTNEHTFIRGETQVVELWLSSQSANHLLLVKRKHPVKYVGGCRHGGNCNFVHPRCPSDEVLKACPLSEHVWDGGDASVRVSRRDASDRPRREERDDRRRDWDGGENRRRGRDERDWRRGARDERDERRRERRHEDRHRRYDREREDDWRRRDRHERDYERAYERR